jgi:hypothetical protein
MVQKLSQFAGGGGVIIEVVVTVVVDVVGGGSGRGSGRHMQQGSQPTQGSAHGMHTSADAWSMFSMLIPVVFSARAADVWRRFSMFIPVVFSALAVPENPVVSGSPAVPEIPAPPVGLMACFGLQNPPR